MEDEEHKEVGGWRRMYFTHPRAKDPHYTLRRAPTHFPTHSRYMSLSMPALTEPLPTLPFGNLASYLSNPMRHPHQNQVTTSTAPYPFAYAPPPPFSQLSLSLLQSAPPAIPILDGTVVHVENHKFQKALRRLARMERKELQRQTKMLKREQTRMSRSK